MIAETIFQFISQLDTDLPPADLPSLQRYLEKVKPDIPEIPIQFPNADCIEKQIETCKHIIPCAFAKVLACQRAIDFLIFLPPQDQRRPYIDTALNEITSYRRQHSEAYRYFTLNATSLDDQLFVPSTGRSPEKLYYWMIPVLPFSDYTIHFSYFLAGIWLSTWIEIHYLNLPPIQPQQITLKWTGSLAALTEIIYALNEMGVLGSGRQEINKLKVAFEKFFNTTIGNIYKSYEHNRIRKKSRTPFLDAMKAALTRRMEEDDENAL